MANCEESPAPIDAPAALVAETARISELLRASDLATPVAHLGRWKIRDVGAHLGGVHRWAARIVTSRSRDGPSFTKSKLDGVELCDWFDEGAAELVQTFRDNDPDGECPNFNPGSPKTVAWWSRRQLHETTVHRWDIESATSVTTPIDPTVAADGIDEFLDTFVRTRGKQTLASTLLVRSDAPARAWTLAPAKKPGRIDVTSGVHGDHVAEVAGAPAELLLALWGRRGVADTDLVATGDLEAVAAMMTL